MVRELAAERALDDGFLESADRGLELLVRDRSLADKLVENLGRDRRQRRLRTLAFRFAVHSHPSCYAPHTNFLTPSYREPGLAVNRDGGCVCGETVECHGHVSLGCGRR